MTAPLTDYFLRLHKNMKCAFPLSKNEAQLFKKLCDT